MSDERREAIGKVLDAHVARILMINSRGMCKHGCSAACATKPCEAWPSRPNAIAVAREHSADRILALMDTPEEVCPSCGSGNAERVRAIAPMDVGPPFGPVEVEHEVIDCCECGEHFYAPGAMDAATLKAFRVHQKAMSDTPEEPVAVDDGTRDARVGLRLALFAVNGDTLPDEVADEVERHIYEALAHCGEHDAHAWLLAHPPRAEGEVVEGWVSAPISSDPRVTEYAFSTHRVVGLHASKRRARLIIEQEDRNV